MMDLLNTHHVGFQDDVQQRKPDETAVRLLAVAAGVDGCAARTKLAAQGSQ